VCNIKEVPSFRYNGKLYDTRSAAVAAGLGEIADDIKRNFAHGPLDGLVKHSAALIFLLSEYRKEEEADGPASSKDPEPDDAPMPPQAVRELLANTIRGKAKNDRSGMQTFVSNAGYGDLPALLHYATDAHVNTLLAKLVESPVSGQVLDVQGHRPACAARATGYEADCRCGVLILNRKD